MKLLQELRYGFQLSNITTQSRVGTVSKVTYPDFPSFTTQPQYFRLHQAQGSHDVVEIAYAMFSPFYFNILKTGVLVKIKWTTANATGEFNGYVYNITPVTQASSKRNVVIKAVGASFPLKESSSKIWTNKTASEIVTDIAKTCKVKPVVTQSPVRFSQQSMVGHTYWEKVQELAHRIGYVAQMIGVELHFHPIDTMIDTFSTSIPVLSFHETNINAGGFFESQTLDMFKPTLGDMQESNINTKKDKTVSGIDPITGKSFKQTSSPSKLGVNLRSNASSELFTQIMPTRMAENPAVAKSMADAFARLSRFSNNAIAAGQGDPRISPYRTVEINGTGDFTDGFWVVKEATHFVTYDGRYSVEFSCMTDGTQKNIATASRPSKASIVPVRNVTVEMTTGAKTKPTAAKISITKPIIKQSQAGYKTTQRKWVG